MDTPDNPGFIEIMKQLEAVFGDGDTTRSIVSEKPKSYAQVATLV